MLDESLLPKEVKAVVYGSATIALKPFHWLKEASI